MNAPALTPSQPKAAKRKKVARLHITAEFEVNASTEAADITTLAKEVVESLRGIGEVTTFKLTVPAHEVKI